MASDWSAKNPYMTHITENFILNGEGSRKETRHIVFALGDSGMDYKVGDALGVIAENPPHIVDELIDVQGWDRDATVTTHNGERTLYEALKKDFEVHMANKKFVKSLAEKVVSSGLNISMSMVSRTRNDSTWTPSEDEPSPSSLRPSMPSDDPASQVEAINADTKTVEDYLWTRDYVDIMREFEVKYTPEEFLELADRLKPRLYSIASSHDAHPGFVELTVGIVRFEYNGRARGGLCVPNLWPMKLTLRELPSVSSCRPRNPSFSLRTKKRTSSWLGPVQVSLRFERSWNNECMTAAGARTGSSLVTNLKRRNFTTKTKSNHGLMGVTFTDLPRHGRVTKRRKSTFNIA